MKHLIILFVFFLLTACSNSSEQPSNEPVTKVANESKPEAQAESGKAIEDNSDHDHHGHDHDHGNEQSSAKGYTELDTPYPTNNTDKVVVYEFFGYLCSHCNDFEPQMTQWQESMPEYVEVVKVPVNFNRGWDVMQLGYITAESMGIAKQNHSKLFEAVHRQRKQFRSINDLAQWYADNSEVTKEEFLSTAQSFIIDSNVRRADKMTFQMQVTGTPTIVINGKYKPINRLKSREDVLNMMDILVEKEAKEMGIIGSE